MWQNRQQKCIFSFLIIIVYIIQIVDEDLSKVSRLFTHEIPKTEIIFNNYNY